MERCTYQQSYSSTLRYGMRVLASHSSRIPSCHSTMTRDRVSVTISAKTVTKPPSTPSFPWIEGVTPCATAYDGSRRVNFSPTRGFPSDCPRMICNRPSSGPEKNCGGRERVAASELSSYKYNIEQAHLDFMDGKVSPIDLWPSTSRPQQWV